MKKYLMILGGFTGILFLFTVIPSRFAAPASDSRAAGRHGNCHDPRRNRHFHHSRTCRTG